jgi:hypothetical protein
MSPQCLSVYKDLAGALTNPAKCSAPANAGTPGCSMLNDLKGFVEDNPGLLMDMLQLVLGMCGLIPGAGEVCDGADAAISFGRGDWVGGLLSVGAMIPVAGWLASGVKALKNSDKLRGIKKIVDLLIKGCKKTNCAPAIGFSDDTVASAYQGMRNNGGHAMKRVIGDLIPNVGSPEAKRQAFEKLTSGILTKPQKSFDWTLGGPGGIRNKGFIGEINGRLVCLFVAKEGQYAGTVTSTVFPSASDLALWGVS